MARTPASGSPFTLAAGDYRADIASAGATLRRLRHGARDLVVWFERDEIRPAMSGAVLAPWPNRLADGRYRFAGAWHQLPLTEPATGTAAHGLVAWRDFTPTSVHADRVRLAATIEPQSGYPWRIGVTVTYELSADGLRQSVAATNLSDDPAPVGLGGHPYLLASAAGRDGVDSWTLEVPADRVLLVDDVRMLPTGLVDVAAEDRLDFRRPRVVGRVALNNAYTGLRRDVDGRCRVRVTRGALGAEIELGEGIRWVQVYTADASSGDDHRRAVAVEPMTCPPDAFTSGLDLTVLAPGESLEAYWTIRAVEETAPARSAIMAP